MKLHFAIASLLIVAVLLTQCAQGSYAIHPSEAYRRNMVPQTLTPKTVRRLLRPAAADSVEEKKIYVGVGKGGVIVDTQKPGVSVDIGDGGVIVDTQKPGKSGTSVVVGKGGVTVDTGKPGGSGASVGVAKGGVSVDTHWDKTRTRT